MDAGGHPHALVLQLPVEPRSVAHGRHAVEELAAQLGLTPDAIWRMRLAVTEALTNAVVHAHRTDPRSARHQLLLLADYDDDALRVSVSDDGVGLSPRSDSPGAGLGLALMATNADALDIETRPGGGTTVHLTFLRRPDDSSGSAPSQAASESG
jgi:anti-sigma regulatory factor (Ser/Thr protein kinase)